MYSSHNDFYPWFQKSISFENPNYQNIALGLLQDKSFRSRTRVSQTTLNTSRNQVENPSKLSPKHARIQAYYKERDLIKGAKVFTVNNPNNRFATNLMDNQTLIQQTLFDQNLKKSFDKLQKRSENITRYYNQQFRDEYQPNEQANLLLLSNRSVERANDSQASFRQSKQTGYNPQTSMVLDIQKSISKIRDRSNEVFVNDEDQQQSARQNVQNHKLRLSLGVFGDFQITTLPQVQSVQQTTHQQKRLIFRTMDKNHYGSNTFNCNQLNGSSRAQTGNLNFNNQISQINKIEAKRGRSVQSNISQNNPILNQSKKDNLYYTNEQLLESSRLSQRNGEVSLRSRSNFQVKDFLTSEEKKFGDSKNLDSINRSFEKLSHLHDRNWSQRDIQKTVYASPNNFHGAYNKNFNTQFNSILGNKRSRIIAGFQSEIPNSVDLRSIQLSTINKMILDKKSNLLDNPANAKVEQAQTISHSLNQEQKLLYSQLKHRSMARGTGGSDNSNFQSLVSDGGQKLSPKKYQSNFGSRILWEAKQRELKSPAGLQKTQYDILTMGDRTHIVQDLSSRLQNKKVNGISEFSQVTHITAPKINKDYQKAFQADPNIFRRSQGILSRFANNAASHKVLIPSFKKA